MPTENCYSVLYYVDSHKNYVPLKICDKPLNADKITQDNLQDIRNMCEEVVYEYDMLLEQLDRLLDKSKYIYKGEKNNE